MSDPSSAGPVGPRGDDSRYTTLVVGDLPAGLAAAIRTAVGPTRGSVSFQSSSDSARRKLAGTRARIRCVLLDASVSDVDDFIAWLRDDARLFDIPVIALVSAPTEEALLEAKRGGADDAVVRSDWAATTRRLAALDCFVPGAHPLPVRGTALVAHPIVSRRRRAGWVLRRAGYELAFAGEDQELTAHAQNPRTKIVVASDTLIPPNSAESVIGRLRKTGPDQRLPVIVLAETEAVAHSYAGLRHAAATVDDGSWEHLLFQLGELTRPDVTDLRSSPRTYYSAFCAFRERTDFEAVYALTYNVSRGGMFIRTMDPPGPQSDIAVELRLHDATRDILHLRGQVVWVQRPVYGSAGPTPAGFGVRIVPEASPSRDLKRYEHMCDALHAEQFPATSLDA
jgi:CheY-like chemotaxis protein